VTIVLNGTTGITNDGGYTGDGIVFADTTPANTLVTTTGGNVGIGTSSPAAKLSIGSLGVFRLQTGSTTMDCTPTAGATDSFVWNLSNASVFAWSQSGTERMRIDSSGNLLVGATSQFDSGRICSDGASSSIPLSCRVTPTTSSTQINFRNGNGTVGSITTNGTSTSFNTSSDYRLKENIAPMTGALARNKKLQPKVYNWKIDGSYGEGFIAHELQQEFPNAVTGTKDEVDAEGKPVHQGISTGPLDGHFAACIDELENLVASQQAIITDLTTRLEALEAK
jgi:hypothetical protein